VAANPELETVSRQYTIVEVRLHPTCAVNAKAKEASTRPGKKRLMRRKAAEGKRRENRQRQSRPRAGPCCSWHGGDSRRTDRGAIRTAMADMQRRSITLIVQIARVFAAAGFRGAFLPAAFASSTAFCQAVHGLPSLASCYRHRW